MKKRLIDVREYPEYATGYIRDSELVPLGTLESACEVWSRSQSLLLICRSGRRSQQAKALLEQKGFISVEVLDGGIEGWKLAGKELTAAEHRPWAMERQVRVVAGSLVLCFVTLGMFSSKAFLIGAAFIGAGLVFAGVSDTCLMGSMLARMSWNRPKKVRA